MSCIVKRIIPNCNLSDKALTLYAQRFYGNLDVNTLQYVTPGITVLVGSTIVAPANSVFVVANVYGLGVFLDGNGCQISRPTGDNNLIVANILNETSGTDPINIQYHVFKWV
jgi:hypothetical protein